MLARDMGEFELIALLESEIRERNRLQIRKLRRLGVDVTLGIGDDAAAWKYPAGIVVSTADAMVEGVHFKIGATPWADLGWKALASNLSDVGAMGCAPTFALVTLGIRGDLPVVGLREMYGGMMDACKYAGGALIGGDVVRSETFFVSVALEGVGVSDAPVLSRSAARPGDLVGVTGRLGSSAGGLALLLEEGSGDGLSPESREELVKAHNRPAPRVAEGRLLRKLGVRCAMDVSDGLLTDLAKLCAASGVSATVELNSLPTDTSLKAAFPDRWRDMALGGGEDYELIFAADGDTMQSVIKALGKGVSVIGRIERGERAVRVVDGDGREVSAASAGWDHFGG